MNALRKHCGATLVELLIAMAIGTLIIAGALTGYARARTAWHTASVQNRLHERAQYVFATLEPELQMAGYFGSSPPKGPAPAASAPASASSCGAFLIDHLHAGVEMQDDRYALACRAQPAAVTGADVLIVRRTSVETSAPEAGRAQWLSGAALSQPGELLWTGMLPAGVALDPPRVELRDVVIRSYYVATAADGDAATPALRVKSLTRIAGAPTFMDTEVMPGVDNLQIELLPATGSPRLARVTLGLRADAADERAGQPLQRLAVTRSFALRNASHAPL